MYLSSDKMTSCQKKTTCFLNSRETTVWSSNQIFREYILKHLLLKLFSPQYFTFCFAYILIIWTWTICMDRLLPRPLSLKASLSPAALFQLFPSRKNKREGQRYKDWLGYLLTPVNQIQPVLTIGSLLTTYKQKPKTLQLPPSTIPREIWVPIILV